MTDTLQETWLPVVGREGLYEVSDHGRVRSVERVVQFGAQTRTVKSTVLKPGKTTKGALFVMLSNGKAYNRRVHQLVLEAFVGPCPPGMEGCHWDDNKENNTLTNLRWDTHSANGLDAVRNGNHTNAAKTHCPRGHEYTSENTKRNGNGRWCRECHRADNRARYQRDIENQRRLKRESKRRSRQSMKVIVA